MKNSIISNISIIIPCYNEEDNLFSLIKEIKYSLQSLNINYEIIFVNDGSTDRTEDIMHNVQKNYDHIRIIRLNKNYGLSTALTAGFIESRGDIIITIDADLQNDPSDIPRLLQFIPEYDIVYGWRKIRNDHFIRILSSKIANSIRNLLTRENILDSACTIKAFKRDCLESIKMYKGMHRFLPTLFKLEGFKTIQIPVLHHRRKHGYSKYGILNRIFISFVDCLAVRWMISRNISFDKTEIFPE